MQLCGFEVGLNRPFILLAGPCVIESEQLTLDIAGKMKEITDKLGIPYVFKASYDKANRSSDTSFRGLGMANGLRILEEVRRQIGVPVVTDVHTADEVPEVASVVDLLQTPAFLCRQTDFIAAHGSLVPVSSTHRCAYTPGLSTSSSSTFLQDSQGVRENSSRGKFRA